MPKVIKIILIVLGVLVVSVFLFLAYMGMFSTPKAEEMVIGPYIYLYEEYVGPYMNSGQIFIKVDQVIKKEGIIAEKGIGIYLDNPSKVDPEKCRSLCGSIVSESDLRKAPQLKKALKVGRLSNKKRIVVKFPIRNRFSFIVGPIKCYPVLEKFITEKGYKLPDTGIEIYDMTAKEIMFIMEIKK